MNGHLETLGVGASSVLLVVGTQLDNAAIQQCAFALGFGGLGACLGALSAAMTESDIDSVELRKRFRVNLLCGIPLGIASGYFVNSLCESVPLWACLIASSAVCGWLGVKLMVAVASKYLKNAKTK